ncbi:dynein axonemal assembly factor 8 isoform X2 [Trachinotus anak]|uniref:dynein axonemal assembly factor 8 isoform X2 n=1 Tax=Trachinotus anak TaxID=443729 RepID=UPI0039F1C9D4
MDFTPSSCWNSILEKVKPHIPIIDFDSPASENEEITTIYQRPAGLSLKVLEDFDSFSVEDAELELLKSVPGTCWSEETCGSLSLKSDDDKIENTTAAQWGTGGSDADADAEVGACQGNIVELNRAKLDTSAKPNVDSMKSDFPVLSFARLDQWDLDSVLQNLKDNGPSLCQHVSVEPAKTYADDKYRSQEIMQRLVAYCESQSKSVSEPGESPNLIRRNNVWSKSLERMAEIPGHQECPTVHIDLRFPDPSINPPRTSPNLSSQSKSPAKYNTAHEAPPAKTPPSCRGATGKSLLLQKIKEMNQNGCKFPNNTDPSESILGNEAEELKDEPPQPAEPACSRDSQHVWLDKQSPPVQSESREPKMENPPTVQQSLIKEPKQQSDQQRQQLKQTLQREQHQQILKQLAAHCPSKSVYQKQTAAERTDVLYDVEASHLQSVNPLTEDVKNTGCMLLTVSLSSPGMVGDRAHGKRNPAATKSHVYNTLVAWFLSLVGSDALDDDNDDEAEGGAKVPFGVAGLQQLWTEDGLVLHVLAVARHCYKPRKRDIDIHAPFYNHVSRFLSETSLTHIAPWLPELEILLNQQAYMSPVRLPSSCLNCFISATSDKKVIDRTFGLTPGFYWQTMETQERACKRRETTQELHTEVSVALGSSGFFLQPLITHYTLQLIVDSGLDVCGLRLIYPPHRFLSDTAGDVPVNQRADDACQPVLALAVRGPYAHSLFKDITSSLDPLLPKKIDPTSASGSQEPALVYSPRLASQVHRELCFWFSGRFQGGSAQNHNQPLNGVVPSDDRSGGNLFSLSRSSAFLCATTKADILLVVSPVVSPCCYGQVLAVCECRGFGLMGLQRLRLQRNVAAVLGLASQQTNVFCSPPAVTLDQEEVEFPSQCLVLILRKENAMHHSVSLPAALMREFKAQKLLGCIHSRLNGVDTVEPSSCFHTVPYSSNLFHIFVRSMWAVPDPPGVILSHHKRLSNSEMEQVVILTLCGKDMSQGLSLLHRVLTEGPEGDAQHARFNLLGLKWLPVLTRLQVQELSPYEVGEQLYRCSQDSLMSSPALVCALRRVDAFASLRKLLPHNYPGNLSVLMSPTPEVAFRQASLFFFDHELIPDPQMQLTVGLFKPSVWNHALTKIFHKLQQSGLMLVGLRVVTLGRSEASSLLSAERESSDSEAHVEYLCSGSSLALCLQGENAVRRLLDVLGQEDSSLWTDCYGSGSHQIATEDVKRLFPDGLCCPETGTMRKEQILSMCSDPLASVEREQRCTLVPVAQETLSPSNPSALRGGSLIHSPVWQTTCLLIPLNAPLLSPVHSQLEMLEQLLRSGCHLVAGRMSMLDYQQRRHIAETLAVASSGNERMTHLYTAPCLIMALQGEKIVTAFSSVLESIYKDRPDLEDVGDMFIYPGSEKEAKQLLCYLFDALSSESCHAIVP